MKTFEIEEDEVILYKGIVALENDNEYKLTLTSKRIILEEVVNSEILDTEELILDSIIPLDSIKQFNGSYLIHQKGSSVEIQSIDKDVEIFFANFLEAKKFVTSAMNAITEKTFTQRGVDKVKGAFNTVDDILGFDTRGTLKGTLDKGLSINIGGISFGKGKKKKKKN